MNDNNSKKKNKMKYDILSLLSSSRKSMVFDSNVSLLAGGGTGKIYF